MGVCFVKRANSCSEFALQVNKKWLQRAIMELRRILGIIIVKEVDNKTLIIIPIIRE